MPDERIATSTGIPASKTAKAQSDSSKGSDRQREARNRAAMQHTRRTSRRKGGIPTRILGILDTIVYILVGVSFLLAALISLIFGVSKFIYSVYQLVQMGTGALQDPIGANGAAGAIITFVSDLLLTLIIMEVLGTVVNYLETHATSLKPFLFIGIISATRGILAVGARLSVSSLDQLKPGEFQNSMIELGVNAAVIIALGVTLKLIGNFLDDDADDEPTDTSTDNAASAGASEAIVPATTAASGA